jgi:hypothetical protein
VRSSEGNHDLLGLVILKVEEEEKGPLLCIKEKPGEDTAKRNQPSTDLPASRIVRNKFCALDT